MRATTAMRMTTAMLAATALLLVGCAAESPSQSSPTPTPSSTPTADLPQAPAVVTFDVAGQGEYSIELVSDELIAHVAELQAGGEEGRIPVGRIVRDGDGGVNAPWSWHIDPATLEFADATIEVCDGLPEYVEDGTLTSDTYCPWNATVVALRAVE